MRCLPFILLFAFGFNQLSAQTLGGNSIYNFLKLSNTPQLTALGGVNISSQSNDVGLAFNNPALLRDHMHGQSNIVFTSMYAGIKNYHLLLAYRHQRLNTNFALGVNYFDYGNIQETDASGNLLSNFQASDYVIQLSVSRNYFSKWHYGASLKFIHSNYGRFRSTGIALDAGIAFTDSSNFIQAAMILKSMGLQIKAYDETEADDLPFDVQVGFSKRLAKAPIQFSITAHHLHRLDLIYNDTAFNNENNLQESSSKKFGFENIFSHIVLSTQVYIEDKVEITTGYNHLRRKELNIGTAGNGLNGFSVGVGVLLKNFQIRYARSYYQNNTAYNQLGLNLQLNQYFGLGKFGSRIGW